jgi:hypothetical protein
MIVRQSVLKVAGALAVARGHDMDTPAILQVAAEFEAWVYRTDDAICTSEQPVNKGSRQRASIASRTRHDPVNMRPSQNSRSAQKPRAQRPEKRPRRGGA